MSDRFTGVEANYLGPERRKVDRRQNPERRQEFRFEIDADDRRQCPGRRRSDLLEEQPNSLWKSNCA